jgi:hypothetical protein
MNEFLDTLQRVAKYAFLAIAFVHSFFAEWVPAIFFMVAYIAFTLDDMMIIDDGE